MRWLVTSTSHFAYEGVVAALAEADHSTGAFLVKTDTAGASEKPPT
jgi:V8-like Glu-specific endopeptidase